MHVMSEFDPSSVTNPQGMINGVSGSPNLDVQSNTYATIQKSHGGTLRSLQLRGLQQSSPGTITLGDEPGESNDYATLDHLKMPVGTPNIRHGPRVPGIETPISAVYVHEKESPEIQELVTSFTGSTFQPPDLTNMANRPLPEEPLEGRRHSKESLGVISPGERNKNLMMNAKGEPCLVAELI